MQVRQRLLASTVAFAAATAMTCTCTQAAVADSGRATTTAAKAASTAATASELSWSANLGAAGAQQVNLARSAGQIRISNPGFHPAVAADRGYAQDLLAPVALSRAVGQVTATVAGTTPSGASVTVDVRAETSGSHWTEWQTASSGETARFGAMVTTVQARITLLGNASGAGPLISGVAFTGTPAATGQTALATGAVAPAASTNPESYRVFATDEGSAGKTTANGHVIQANDHFVALPSGTALSPSGSDEYSVKVCGPVGCETAPVWDVGPWNIKDNYWDPSSSRQEFSDLPQGTPEAQAAYEDGYNGGVSGIGDDVSNPAGIDLADGTFHDVLGSDNGYVTVTYLWTSTSGGTTAADPESSPLSTYGSQMQVFGSSAAGTTFSDVYTPGKSWSGWTSLGGTIADDPTAVEYNTTTYGDQMEVFGRTSGGSVYSRVYTPNSGWSEWMSLGGDIVSDPVAIQYGTQMQVFGRAASGAIYSDVYTPGKSWSGWTSIGGVLTGNVSLLNYGTQLQVFGRSAAGTTFSDVYTPGKSWSGWTSIGGNLASDPVAIEYDTSTYGDQVQVYGLSASGATWSDVWASGSGWSGWTSIGGDLAGNVTPIVYGSQMEVFGRSAAGTTFSDVYTPGKTWSGWTSIGGTIADNPIPIQYGSQMQVFGRSAAGTTFSDVYTPGKSWSGWTSLGGDLQP
jgi:hypothetical protein